MYHLAVSLSSNCLQPQQVWYVNKGWSGSRNQKGEGRGASASVHPLILAKISSAPVQSMYSCCVHVSNFCLLYSSYAGGVESMLWRLFHPPNKLWKLRVACYHEWQTAITFAMVTVAIIMHLEMQVPIELMNLPRADSEADLREWYNPPSLKEKFMTFTSGLSVNMHYVAYIYS